LETHTVLVAPLDRLRITGLCRFPIPFRSRFHVPLDANPVVEGIRVVGHTDGFTFFRTLPKESRCFLEIARHTLTIYVKNAKVR
jgi:hypothetical protein